MSYIHEIPDEQATDLAREQYDQDIHEDGYIKNTTRIFSLRPDVYAVWRQMIKQLRTRLRLRPYELVTMAAARAIGCKY